MTKQEQLIIILLILAALIGTGLLYFRKSHEDRITPEVVRAKGIEAPKEIVVDVKGACWKPGVYSLPYGARVKDLLERALPREDADLSTTNLARRLKDGEGIFIPGQNILNTAGISRDTGNYKILDERVNINLATTAELERLPRIGAKIASAIIDYRNTHGPFSEIVEIKKVDGIGEEIFKKIEALITVK